MGGEPLDGKSDIETLRVCDRTDCINARHYDFTHRKTYRDQILQPNPEHYVTLDDGSIMPIWEGDESEANGVVLPSVAESATDLRELQLRCVPYVDTTGSVPLTANGISKITIDETTGCWPVRMYYTRPNDFGQGFQYDGYGRLDVGPGL